jgi:hypothetical protein
MQPKKWKLFSKDSEIVSAILDWRSLIKLQNTYVEALPLQVDAVTKRIHTDYMQTVAATGRLSSTNPICKISLFVPNGDKKSEKHLLPAMKLYYNLCRLLSNWIAYYCCEWRGKHDKSFSKQWRHS